MDMTSLHLTIQIYMRWLDQAPIDELIEAPLS
uniref:Uncharacterized protein n=1 Tax=Arundo donax TaxID=35708 RepID=A0A0A9ABD2_ARUDO